jgi:hypothetical protein
MSKEIKGVEILGVEMSFYCEIPHGSLNIGLLTLENEGRSFVFDSVESIYSSRNSATDVTINLEVDEDLDNDCKYDLTSADLFSRTIRGNLWFEEAVELSDGNYVEPDSVTLFVKFINEDGSGCTKAIDLNL